MTSNAIQERQRKVEGNHTDAIDFEERGTMLSPSDWVDRMIKTMGQNDLKKQMKYATTVHPCVIDGKRVLVFEKNLDKKDPEAYQQLRDFADANGFNLKEDARRNLKRVRHERRTKMMPMMVLGASLFMQNAAQADQQTLTTSVDTATNVIPAVEVLGTKQSSDRPYLQRDGKRFIAGPYGEMEAILAVSAEIKAYGTLKRVSTRGMTMPSDYISKFVNRYEYQFPVECGGAKYSYYEGEGFGALGYHHGEKVVLDVLAGGGPFSSPQLWGPYDQVLNDNIEMHLMMGDGKKDGMGLLKASYAIGMTPIMADEDFHEYGASYTSSTMSSANCVNGHDSKPAPVIRQAKLDI
jgi:uncharacterized protein DUF3579